MILQKLNVKTLITVHKTNRIYKNVKINKCILWNTPYLLCIQPSYAKMSSLNHFRMFPCTYYPVIHNTAHATLYF